MPANGAPLPPFVVTLMHEDRGGQAQSAGGVISTRAANAAAWSSIRGVSPVGRRSVGVDAAAIELLEAGEVEDLMLVIGYEAQAPAWPT